MNNQMTLTHLTNKKSERTLLKEGYIKLLEDHYNVFFITIVFDVKVTDWSAYFQLNEYLDELNWVVLGDKYRKKGVFIEGVAVAERHSQKVKGVIHFHIVIFDDERKFKSFFRFERQLVKAHGFLKKRLDNCLVNRVHLTRCYDDVDREPWAIGRTREEYMVKNFDKKCYSMIEVSEAIGLLSVNGVIFGDIKLNRY